MRAELERFLDGNGPSGGTELGTALEAALRRRPELPLPSARHCLVLTDGQVTDQGRILEVVTRERARPDARRVSVLCIDSSPNASLATELAESGGGSAHFLSSDPTDGDVATALEEVLEGFAPPLAVGLALSVDRRSVESAAGEATHADGAVTFALGDLVASRPAWAVLRLPAPTRRAPRSASAERGCPIWRSRCRLPRPTPTAPFVPPSAPVAWRSWSASRPRGWRSDRSPSGCVRSATIPRRCWVLGRAVPSTPSTRSLGRRRICARCSCASRSPPACRRRPRRSWRCERSPVRWWTRRSRCRARWPLAGPPATRVGRG
jgi:hypothetical protein